MSAPIELWDVFVAGCAPVFTQPSFELFEELLRAWIQCPGRHTVTRMIRMLDPSPRRAHDAYHRFLREGTWDMAALWRLLALALAAALTGSVKALDLDLDDTLFHKTGRRVDGAGNFRDAVRSTTKRVVYALGLNLVVMTLRIQAPWGGEPLALPINVRVYRKGGPSHLDMAVERLREVTGWFPKRKIHLCADGAYASLAGRMLPNCDFTSRMRRDAALYKTAPKRKEKRRGRPRKKGERLPTPEEMARRAKKWTPAIIDFRGRPKERLIHARRVLWYATCPTRQVLLVIVRDPVGKEPDDFFFTTEVEACGLVVVSRYAGRWAIEDTFQGSRHGVGIHGTETAS